MDLVSPLGFDVQTSSDNKTPKKSSSTQSFKRLLNEKNLIPSLYSTKQLDGSVSNLRFATILKLIFSGQFSQYF